MPSVLVVDDNDTLRYSVMRILSENHLQVDDARNGEEALNRIVAGNYDLVLLDISIPGTSGLEVLKEIKLHDPSIIVIIISAFSNVRDAVQAIKAGAYDYIEKPLRSESLAYTVERALRAKQMVRDVALYAPEFKLPNGIDFIGRSSQMKRVFNIINKLSRVDTPVLIRGESGTGKELVAQALHFYGPRKDNRFVTINCSAIPEGLIESDFFGHEKGAFTGADSKKIGKFQYANGGTIFLDEIGDISPGMQIKLLRFLQEGKFTPVGSNREMQVNVRVVAATNRELEEMILSAQFREDLFYRLNVLPVHLPPLRERRNDIKALASYFMSKFKLEHNKNIVGISNAAMALLERHSWPGNIRELENVIEHALVIATGPEITPASLPESVRREENDHLTLKARSLHALPNGFTLNIRSLDYPANKEEFEKQFLISALRIFGGRINQTALRAKIPKKTLLRKLEKYGINPRDYT